MGLCLVCRPVSLNWYTYLFRNELKHVCTSPVVVFSRSVDYPLVAFDLFLIFCRVVFSLTHSLFALSMSLSKHFPKSDVVFENKKTPFHKRKNSLSCDIDKVKIMIKRYMM